MLGLGGALQGFELFLCALPRFPLGNEEQRLLLVRVSVPPLGLRPGPSRVGAGGRGHLRLQPCELLLQLVLPPLHGGYFDVVHRVKLLPLVLHHPLCPRQLALEGLPGGRVPPPLRARDMRPVAPPRAPGSLARGLSLEDPRPLRLYGAHAPLPPGPGMGAQALLGQILWGGRGSRPAPTRRGQG